MTAMPVLKTEEKYGLTLHFHDFGQGAFAQYQMETLAAAQKAFFQFAQNGSGVSSDAFERGEALKAAIRNGIVSGVTIESVNELKPFVVSWAVELLKAHIKNVTTEPADPNS